MRPVRELSASPACFSRARGTPEHPQSLVMRVAVAAFHWPMACARIIIVIDLRCCQIPRVREFPPSSACFSWALRTTQRLLL
eukprot:6884123-Pyramimonas_sp.AAC.1